MMLRILPLILTPSISLLTIVLANGFLGTLLTLRLKLEGGSVFTIGCMSTSYYAGQVLGAFVIERFVARVGHIRAYAAFAAVCAIIALLQGMVIKAPVWILLRFLSGYCMAGIFVIVESWFLSVNPGGRKGQIIALYMTIQYAAMALGQFLLNLGDPSSLYLFCVAAILISFSIVPLAMTYLSTPPINEPAAKGIFDLIKISPVGAIGCMFGGCLTGGVYSLMPWYVLMIDYAYGDIAWVMGLIVCGGMLLQYPMGHLSDLINRKYVLMGLCATLLILAACMPLLAVPHKSVFLGLCVLFGGVVFVFYPIATSECCDYVEAKELLSVAQGLLLLYGAGAMTGPLLVALLLHSLGKHGYFMYYILMTVSYLCFIAWQLYREQDQHYLKEKVFTSAPNTPVGSALNPRLEDEAPP